MQIAWLTGKVDRAISSYGGLSRRTIGMPMARKDYYTCYLTERDGIFEGMCVDFDISVQGNSIEDARIKLEHAVHGYLAAVMEEAPEHRKRLLDRRTPWPIRAKFAVRVAFTRIVGHGHDARFALPCHV